MPQASDWQPTTAEVAGLGPRTLAWLHDTLGAFQFDAVDGQRLLASMRTQGRIEALEVAIAAAGVSVAGEPHALLAALAREQRVFLSQWAALQLGREK